MIPRIGSADQTPAVTMHSTGSPGCAILTRCFTVVFEEFPVTLLAQPVVLKSNLVKLFEHLAGVPWSLFLDTATATHTNARFDMVFYQPERTYQLNGDTITLGSADYQQRSTTGAHYPASQWQQLLRTDLASVPSYTGPAHLPFQGGLAGAFGYDFGRQLEQLNTQADADIDLPEMAVALYHKALIFDKQQQQLYLLAPESQWQQEAAFWQGLAERPKKPQPAAQFKLLQPWQSNLTAADYADRFAQVMQHLRQGDCYQINLAQRFSSRYEGSEWNAYLRLRAHNQGPFSAFMQLASGAILSLSPERFIALDTQGNIETKPIKGTRPRHADATLDQQAATELQQASKDRAENVMIVDLLRNDLSRVCDPGSVNVPALFKIESFPAVHHLVSTVHAKLSHEHDMLDVIAATFPGGSITGAPKISAMNIIDQLEPHRRSFYCGSMGYISQHGAADTSIMIRTLVCANQQIYCWAGGGLVIDSECAAEYQETFDKVGHILPILAETAATTEPEL
ncbi:MAG: aminodeoxychorismate synthase component I [Idiomarina sp.]